MKKLCGAFLFLVGFMATTHAVAQIYDNKHDALTGPMDRVADLHAAVYANVGSAGQADENLSQEERYTKMTDPTEDANERHLNTVIDDKSIQDAPVAK